MESLEYIFLPRDTVSEGQFDEISFLAIFSWKMYFFPKQNKHIMVYFMLRATSG